MVLREGLTKKNETCLVTIECCLKKFSAACAVRPPQECVDDFKCMAETDGNRMPGAGVVSYATY